VPSIRARINAAAQLGQISNLVKVVKELLVDVPIDNVMVVNFAGFRAVVDQLGGVPVYFPYDAQDKGSFFEITAGCHVLTGEQALSYVRSREYEQKINGKFVADNQVDYARTERQRDFLVLALDQAIQKQSARNPTVLKRLLHSAAESRALQLDNTLTVQNLIDLAQAFSSFAPENLQRGALPTTETVINGAQVLLIDKDLAQPILDVYRGKGNTLEPRQVSVQLTDARGKVTEPVKPSAALGQLGFSVTTKAAPSGTTEARTVIAYSADQRAGALLLSRFFVAEPVLQEVTGVRTLRATVGLDFEGLLPEAKPEPTATATAATGTANGTAAAPPTTPSIEAPSTPAPDAPTTTSGIYGRPPEGITCK
jgi:LCP family protein required for cell wall assembly